MRSTDLDASAAIDRERATAAYAADAIQPDQVGDVARRRPTAERVDGASLHDAPVLEDRDAVGERQRVVEIMRYDDACAAERLELTSQHAA